MSLRARRTRGPDSRLVFALALIGALALFAKALFWYADHLQRISTAVPVSVAKAGPTAAPAPTTQPGPESTPVPLPPPEDVAALSSRNASAQFSAIERLRRSAMTPELVSAIKRCVPATPQVEAKLNCLRARLPGQAAIDWTVARLAKHDAVWSSEVDECVCLLEALADRVDESPEPIARAVFPFALSYIARPREPALRALASARLTTLPPAIRAQIDNAWHHQLAVRAALTLGMSRLDPYAVEQWLFDPDLDQRARSRSAVVESNDPASAHVLVRSLLDHADDADLVRCFSERDRRHQDASAELVGVALDESAPQGSRQRALELLGTLGSRKSAELVAPLLRHPDQGLRAYAEAASVALAKR